MKKYKILYTDKHTEVVDHKTMDNLVYELEMFERYDVSQIHELNEDGTLGETIWTEEEGLFISYGQLNNEEEVETEIDPKYVVVLDFEEGICLEDAYILGWDNQIDWYTEVEGSDIMTNDGKVKPVPNRYGTIDVSRLISAYVDASADGLTAVVDGASLEGYNCTVCRIETNADDELILVKV
jgi:hypothetical protein